jgi:predicted ATP-dependent Lon-type protease
MAINDVKTECTAMYTLLSGYLTEVAASDGYDYFETNASTITTDILEQSRKILKEAVDTASVSPDDAATVWDLVTLCNAAVQDTLSLIDAKNQADKFPAITSATGTIRWLLNTTTKR